MSKDGAAIGKVTAEYYDKHGVRIKENDMISIAGDEPEKVYACGEGDLGINASNEAYLKNHPDARTEYYLLSNFDLNDIEIQ